MQLFLNPFSPPASFLYCDVTAITSSLHHTLLHQTPLNILVFGRTDVLREHTCTVTSCLSVLSVDSVSRSAALDASICHSDWTMEAKHKGVSPHRRANGLILLSAWRCLQILTKWHSLFHRGRSRAHPEQAHVEQEYKSLCFVVFLTELIETFEMFYRFLLQLWALAMSQHHESLYSIHRLDLRGRGLLTTTTSCFFYFCWTVGDIVW